MKSSQKVVGITLAVLLGIAAYSFYRTGQSKVTPRSSGTAASSPTASLVDQTPLLTAQQLAKLPTTADELPFAQDALRLSDHDMDLAYADAERKLEDHPPALSPEAKRIAARLKAAEDALEADADLVKRLTDEVAKASGATKDALAGQLVLAQAHQEEHQDEVDDAKEDLAQAGGDPQSRIAAMMAEHKASSDAIDNEHISVTPPVTQTGLIHLLSQWSALHQKQLQLWSAKQQAESAAALFSSEHNALETQLNAGQAGASPGTNLTADQTAALVTKSKQRAADQKKLSSFDRRRDDQKQLADNYGSWIGALAAEQRSLIHRALIGVLVVLGILLIGLFFDGWIERLLGKTKLDRRQVETLRTVTRVALQVVGVVFILLVIFGLPSQLGTFLGLAGAGLTVALKDLIVGFIGWFVLMGRNGIRLGDWVEINGVTGEVVELGMFHTVLLETGNWTDSGHPTGRRVTFTNSFAIEGHYFNFSTSGQWLWDELQLVLPAGKDFYHIVDAIQKKVVDATAESAHLAEQEWKNAARSREMKSLSAAPAINIKPVAGGVELAVRYITRANERYRLRAKLYQAAVDLMGPTPAA